MKMKKGRKGERERGREAVGCVCVGSFLPSACVVVKAREAEDEDDDDAMHKSERERIWKVGNVFGIK